MKQKKKFFQKSTFAKRLLSIVLTFAMVLTMGMFPQLESAAAGEGTDSSLLLVHFKNEMDWETVYAKYGSGSNWTAIPGYESASTSEFGVTIAPDQDNDGWYTYRTDLPADIAEVHGLFNNGAWGNENQTGNYAVTILGDTEAWITYTGDGNAVGVSKSSPEGWVGEVIDNAEEETPDFTDATITMHFKNTGDWEDVYAYLAQGSDWSAISGYAYAGSWPGAEVETDAANDGWYSFTIKMKLNQFNLIFNNNGKGIETNSITFTPKTETTEYWVTYEGGESGKEYAMSSDAPDGWTACTSNPPVNPAADTSFKSPVVNEDRSVTITFWDANGKYADAEDVRLMGTLNGTDWNDGMVMEKGEDNTWSATTPVQSPGVYGYKIKIGEDWLTDPLNEQTTSDGNSKVVIAGLADAFLDAVKGKRTALPETLTLYDENGNAENVNVTYTLADASLTDLVTISDGGIIISEDADVETVVLNAAYDNATSKITVSVKDAVYTYNIYYFDHTAAHMSVDAADIHAWEVDGGNLGPIPFSSLETLEDGNAWLKATLTTSAVNLGLIPRSKDAWDWQTTDHMFMNEAKAETCNIYIVYGDSNTYTELPTVKEQKNRFVIVDYERPNGDYEGWNIYSWNTGLAGETELYTEVVNGRHIITVPIADYDVDLLLAFCMRQVVGDEAWADKDGGDHYVNVPADQTVVKARFVQGKGITEVLPYNTGYELDGAENQIHFYYRDDVLFQKGALDTLKGKVQLVVGDERFDMEYDEDAERFYCDYTDVETGEYSYHYMVDGKAVLDAFNPNTTEDGTNSVLTYKVLDIALAASVLNASMTSNDNNVLSVSFTGTDADKIAAEEIASITADLSALGLGTFQIDPELMKGSIACLSSVSAGVKKIPVTLKDIYGNVYETTVSVTVTKRSSTGGDFDWDEAIIYFAVTDRFFDGNTGNNEGVDKDGSLSYHGGDFAGLNQKLDYLQELGVNTIWITPIVENSDTSTDKDGSTIESTGYHGYWASDFTKLNSHLGTPEEFSALLDAAHKRGIKIMVDVVLNHAGYNTEEHFNTILKDADGNYITMIRDSSNTVTGSDIYAPLSGLPDFLTEDATVRNQLIQWQTDWMDKYDIDYYRVDTVKHVDATTWSAFKNALTEVNPAFKMTGEYAGAGFANNAEQLGTGRMDALLDFDFNGFAADFLTGNLSSVESSLIKRNAEINNTAAMSSFLNSHDEDGLQYTLQNSYQLSAEEAKDLMKVAATLSITAKGQPVIYYGEEIGQYGQNNYPYQTNRYDFDWEELEAQQADSSSLFNHYKTMLAIRNLYTDVFARGDRQSVLISDENGYDVISRSYDETTLYIGMNTSSEARTVQIPVSAAKGSVYTNLYDDSEYTVAAGQTISIPIPAAKDGGTVILILSEETGEEPSPSEEPVPSKEPSPSEEPAPSEEPSPSEEPAPSEEPSPSGEPAPSEEPSPSGEPAPSEEPSPSQEPGETIPDGWVTEGDENQYWYEDGVKQGTEGRGKEVYDPASDAWYWLDAVDGGKMAVNKDVYLESYAGRLAEHADGTGKWVRYDENGHMVKGWDITEDGTWYFDPVYGSMAKSYVEIEGNLYYFDRITGIGTGTPCSRNEANGWLIEEDSNRFWYEDGVKQGTEGRGKEIYDPVSDAWYWLDAIDGGKMAVNKDVYLESYAGGWAENPDGTGKWVRYDGDGRMVKEWDTTEAGTWYFDPIYGAMAKGTVTIDGSEYRFDSVTGIQIGKQNRRFVTGQKH